MGLYIWDKWDYIWDIWDYIWDKWDYIGDIWDYIWDIWDYIWDIWDYIWDYLYLHIQNVDMEYHTMVLLFWSTLIYRKIILDGLFQVFTIY